MYEEFFGLRRKPFELVPNPDFLYMSRSHNKAGIYLNYALQERAGFILLTGEVGSGKTTIIRRLLGSLGSATSVSKVFNTRLQSDQLIATINDDFGLQTDGRDKVQMLRDLYQYLIQEYSRERRALLIVDEAQNLSVESLEELRMLSNLETDDSKLLQTILVGQPELRETLSRPELRQLRQRISIHCHLSPLTPEETRSYILHRLEIAGNREAIRFEEEALWLIHEYTGGIPRLINLLCDFILLTAFSEDVRRVSAELVDEVAGDDQFQGQFRTPGPRPVRKAPAPPVGEEEMPADPPEGSSVQAEGSGVSPDGSGMERRREQIHAIRRRLDVYESDLLEAREGVAEKDLRLEELKEGIDQGPARAEVIFELPDLEAERKQGWSLLSEVRRFFLK